LTLVSPVFNLAEQICYSVSPPTSSLVEVEGSVSLKADEILKSFKQHGTRVAIISFISAIALGVTDQFTSKIVPSLVEKIEYYFVPPKFFITFSPPVDVSGGLTVSPLETQDKTPVSVSESVPGTRIFTALAVPGTYVVRLRGGAVPGDGIHPTPSSTFGR
jgi:hypothetical protein